MKKFQGIIPQELTNSIEERKCVLFIGSGLSSKVKRSNGKNLPSWSVFLEELLDWAIDKNVTFWSDPEEIRDMISRNNLLMAAQELQECIGVGEFSDFLNLTFRDEEVKPTETHRLINKINFRAILTSNYDALVEGGYSLENSGKMPVKFTQEDLKSISSPLRKNKFFLFKIHGDIDRPETIILGSRSYSNLLFRTPEYLNFLETLFTTHTVLFVGFGGSDPDLDYILDRLSSVFSRTLDRHFVLLPETKFNLTEKRRLLLDKRLEIIEYKTDKTHSQVDSFLNELYQKTENKVVSEKQADQSELKNILIISSQKDEKIQNQIANRIRKSSNNYQGWLFSETFDQTLIKKHFKNTQIGLVIITKNSSTSEQFGRELEYILLKESENRIKLLFLVIGEIDPPKILMNKLYTRIPELNENTIAEIDKMLKGK
ncbi:MAG: SIR2 family protein [bacterium]|nr:SIR2 family protein [bacterium]